MDVRDERMHPVGGEAAWSESYYFNFYDPEAGIGMFTRMGLRPNEGWCDALHVVYLGGDRVAFTHTREDLREMSDRLRIGALVARRVEPMKRWGIEYDGPAQDIADAAILITRRRERPEGWFRPARLTMSVDFEAGAEPYYAARGRHGHFEQTGRVRGTVALDARTWNVDGWGVRDKSWGPRTWQSGGEPADAGAKSPAPAGPSPFVAWFSINWGPDIALGCSCARGAGGDLTGSGWIQSNGVTQELPQVRVTSSTYEPGSILHRGMRIDATAADGTGYSIAGDVITVCPTKIPMASGATFVNEGLTRFTLGDRVGYGIAEYWHSVELSE